LIFDGLYRSLFYTAAARFRLTRFTPIDSRPEASTPHGPRWITDDNAARLRNVSIEVLAEFPFFVI
jgi:hypothetical protein